MTIENKTILDHIHTASTQTPDHRIRNVALKVGFFNWHYFEMMLAMGVGSSLFELLVRKLPIATKYATGLWPATFLYTTGIALSMMVVMVAWMIVRGHGWRHSAEMAVAMLVPVSFVAVISIRMGGPSYFADTYCSAMCVGMFAAMLFRLNHFTRWSFKASHAGH